MKKYRFTMSADFEVPDNVDLCNSGDNCCDCGGECDQYFFDRLEAWIGGVKSFVIH